MPSPDFLLFYRPGGQSEAERRVDAARAATLRDTAARARAAGFQRVIIATTTAEPFADLGGVELDLDPAPRPFGERLRAVLARYRPAAICYAGAGLPAMTCDHWATIHDRLSAAEGDARHLNAAGGDARHLNAAGGDARHLNAAGGDEVCLVNNLYSTDLLATNAVAALADFPLAARDNALGLFLRDTAQLSVETLSRSAATLLDIDTPADLRLLALAAAVPLLGLGPDLCAVLAGQRERGEIETDALERALDEFTRREAQVLVVGRVGSAVWEALERETAARVRVIAEERGLSARPADQARSMLGFHLRAVGPEPLVEALAELGDAVFLDTRPLFAHLGWAASRADRFRSDLGDWRGISQPDLAAFTAAVAEARCPIVLGGHSLVSGGLLAAIDIAWARWEAQR